MPHPRHSAGGYQYWYFGLSTSFIVVPGSPGCLPGARLPFSRSDRSRGSFLPFSYGLSEDGGFDDVIANPVSVTMMSGRWPPSWLNQTSIMCSESRIVPCTTLAPSPAAWSLIMFSHVTPLFGPKYFLFGRA